jgi:hypothetical protein
MAKYSIQVSSNNKSTDKYNVDTKQAIKEEFGYHHVNVIDSDKVEGKTSEGKPIFMELTFQKTGDMKKDLDIACAIVEVNLAKTIVKTELAGGRKKGTVKEQIGFTDYSVSIKGMIISSDGSYPHDEVLELKAMAEATTMIGINHKLLLYMGITNIVIESIDFPNKQGFQNVQPFSISAISDEAYELKYINEQDAKK